MDLLELIFLTFVRKFPISYSISSFFKRIFFFGIHTSVVTKKDSEQASCKSKTRTQKKRKGDTIERKR